MINSLQGLRTLAMLGIFLFHSGLLLNGTFPVIFFFMLSGFVLYWSYNTKINEINIKEIIFWVKKRMKKLYPIHLITFVMSIFIRWDWIMKLSVIDIIINTILNLTLLQTLFPKYAYSFNGLSWFLSVTMLLYIMAIPLIYIIKNIKVIKAEYMIIAVCLIRYLISIINNLNDLGLDLYTSPFFRIFDFVLGMLVANMLIKKRESNNKFYEKYTIYEIVICISFFIVYASTFIIKVDGTLYSILFTALIYVMAQEKGGISNLLKLDILQKWATFSFEFYMVHELILIAFRKVFQNINYNWIIKNFIIALPSFIISMVIAKFLNEYITKGKLIKKIKKNITIV
ncbi:acyltransferase [Clostridium celatum]|uniref:acyltransferase family protein n=1 Tax=Clostridium celatum TaxID=36834 RepID=UPI002901C9AF|nr:acyltransferase [Clostridium celatum]MDU2265553.1 acyltransferase [Clostridium celatum]MDU6295409.1 acyltransferase [Clostridium celatum]